MTGDAPQPGQTPRNQGNPWTRTEAVTPVLEPPEPARHTGAAAIAHQAGTADATAALTGTTSPALPPAPESVAETSRAIFEAPPGPDATATPPAPVRKRRKPRPVADKSPGAENAHDTVDDERFNTEGSTIAYAARATPEPPVTDPEHEPTIVDLLAALPMEDPRPARAPGKPTGHLEGEAVETTGDARTGADDVRAGADDVREGGRDRPTVVLPRFPGRGRLSRAKDDRARADRALQDRVRAERTAALLETSPFWRTEEDRARDAAWPPQATRDKLAAGQPPRRKPRDPRRPVSGLLALLTLALVAAFFSWVSAEPFWLAVGHGRDGTAVVSHCSGSGVTKRCLGTFAATDGSYSVQDVALLGVDAEQRATGSTASARMVSMTSRQAYVGDTGPLVHLRWVLGFVLVLLCGLGIAGLTGAGRLETIKARRGALAVSVAGPLILLAGFLFAAY
ncbi:hypothetical protein [Actinoplanes sp. NPDC051494]|uniref:hypothetical protein n=1 Tax=Actinoplanes sp. NPDC051494 TaxID=3363907 RepID=UPI00378D244C